MTRQNTLAFAFALLAGLLTIQSANAGVMSYTTRASFNAATYDLNTQNFDFLDDLTRGTGVVINNPLNSSTDNAYVEPGDIIAGLEIDATTNYGEDLALLTPDFAETGLKHFSVFSNNFGGLDFTLNPGVTAFSINVLSLFSSGDAAISVYDPSLTLLGTFTLLDTPNTGSGEFFGVTAYGADTIGSVNLNVPWQAAGVDQVKIGSALSVSVPALVPAPEPGTVSLLGAGLIGLGGLIRRKLNE
jgi:hypothetical protein